MEILLILTGLLMACGWVEGRLHRSHLGKVPIRIHVNGTRGKSSLTRLIAAGLRSAGIRTMAKTTGSAARLIYPDGSEVPIGRRGETNIIEHLAVFREAVAQKAQALVIECMAIRPDLQRVCEERIVRSTLGVISNARADHLDLMGPRVEDVAEALCGTLPGAGLKCFTAETKEPILRILKEQADQKKVHLIRSDASAITDAMMKEFRYLEHKENLALALAVCREFGIREEQALPEMHRALPDLGALRTYHFSVAGKAVEVIDAFAANDPTSILNIWMRMSRRFREDQTKIILLNTRKERLHRSEQLAEFIAKHIACDYVFLIGDDPAVIRRHLAKHLTGPCEVVACHRRPIRYNYRHMVRVAKASLVVFEIGNIGGAGHAWRDFFARVERKHREGPRASWKNSRSE